MRHLVAEYRELPRVFPLAIRALSRGDTSGPSEYTLGTGHVRFFYKRLGYLTNRFNLLVTEMERRGYKPQFKRAPVAPPELMGDWEPTQAAIEVNRMRISERTLRHE